MEQLTPKSENHCPFCDIAADRELIAETEHSLAFYDKYPVNPGHAHIHLIPRYRGDVPEPRGGIRGVIPGKQKY